MAKMGTVEVSRTTKESESSEEVEKAETKVKAKSEARSAKVKTTTKAKAGKTGKAKKDDLKKIEGIGPKISQLLIDDGIDTFVKLSKAEIPRLKRILSDAGPRYQMHNPSSWPMQSELAADGKWEELDKWQDEHKGGKM